MDADELLNELERGPYGEGDLGALVLAVEAINREVGAGKIAAGDRDRLRKLVNRLQRVARDVATASGAQAFSITAGLPVGVSVTVEWPVR